MPEFTLWTSGTSEGVLSADNPMWCATNQFLDTKQWDDGYYNRLSSPLTHRFLALELRTYRVGIYDHLGTAAYFVICEN